MLNWPVNRKTIHSLVIYAAAFSFLSTGCNNDSLKSGEKAKSITNEFSAYDFSKAESGDIVLKRGKGGLSTMIAKKLNEKVPLSHCGIILEEGGNKYIIHSVAEELTGIDGVQKTGMIDFTADCVKDLLYIVRLKKDKKVREKIAMQAELFMKSSIPFDYELNFGDASRLNCSELVYHSLIYATGVDYFEKIALENQVALSFNSLLDTNRFEMVYHY